MAMAATSLTISAPEKIEKGKAFAITYKVVNAPENASLGFWVKKDLPEADRYKIPGPEGVMMLKTIPVLKGGQGNFTWDGYSFGCAPTDLPKICRTPLEPGKVILDAVLYEGKDISLVHGFVSEDSIPKPNILARAKSASLNVFGAIDMSVVESQLLGRAHQALIEEFKLFHYSGTEIRNYIEPQGAIVGPDAVGNYCSHFSYKVPFFGEVKVCGPNALEFEKFIITGKPSFSPGVLSYAEAYAKARAVAEKPYLSRVRFRHQPEPQDKIDPKDPNGSTYLSDGLTNWAYRSDGAYWAFLVYEIMAGGGGERKGEFADNVLVRVENSGKACVVNTFPYRGGININIFKDKIECK